MHSSTFGAKRSAWTLLADEYESFVIGATGAVRYGFEPTWVELELLSGEHLCGNALFGDPLVGVVKRCELRADGGPAPSISGFAPTSGPVGTIVTVSGTGLAGVTAAGAGGPETTSDAFANSWADRWQPAQCSLNSGGVVACTGLGERRRGHALGHRHLHEGSKLPSVDAASHGEAYLAEHDEPWLSGSAHSTRVQQP